MKNTGIVIVSLIGGMIVGSALAMLLTPQSGPELRRHIKDFIDDEVEKAKERAEKIHDKIKSELDEARCKCDEHHHA